MKRSGPVGWFTHDITHRGITAWALSGVILGFYFGLYIPGETKRLGVWLGLAVPDRPLMTLADLSSTAPLHLRFPGLGAWAAVALLAAVTAVIYGYFARRDAGGTLTDDVRRSTLRAAGLSAGVGAFTLYTSLGFAHLLERPEVRGRHLLQLPGEHWPAWVLALFLVPLTAGLGWGLARTWTARRDRGAMLRALSLCVGMLSGVTVVLVYGTHLLEPTTAVPAGEHSLRAFVHRLYFALDSKWTLYGLVYTLSVLTGGVYMLGRYGHNRYQVVRTLVVVAVQSTFGFSVPVLLGMFALPEYYLSYFWPLKIDAFYPDNILRDPTPFVLWSFVGSLVLVPVLGIFFGKRWYCSWVCGCGGLANTAGEPWRHLSQKGESAWRFEKVAIYTVLALAIVTTLLVVLAGFVGGHSTVTGAYWPGHGGVGSYRVDGALRSEMLVGAAAKARYYYGLVVTAVLSGAVGVGLYPIGGTRQWCRNFCPMAAFLGLIQKFGRYRIRVKKDMCISCGMCTKYCEMGIDVRAYAQANQSFTRASCVGCGMCAEVCPRGVLSLEQRFPRDPQEARGELVQIRLHR